MNVLRRCDDVFGDTLVEFDDGMMLAVMGGAQQRAYVILPTTPKQPRPEPIVAIHPEEVNWLSLSVA